MMLGRLVETVVGQGLSRSTRACRSHPPAGIPLGALPGFSKVWVGVAPGPECDVIRVPLPPSWL
jgi:hypothetical protein